MSCHDGMHSIGCPHGFGPQGSLPGTGGLPGIEVKKHEPVPYLLKLENLDELIKTMKELIEIIKDKKL